MRRITTVCKDRNQNNKIISIEYIEDHCSSKSCVRLDMCESPKTCINSIRRSVKDVISDIRIRRIDYVVDVSGQKVLPVHHRMHGDYIRSHKDNTPNDNLENLTINCI